MDHEFFTPGMGRAVVGRSKHRPEGQNSSSSIGMKLLYHCESGSNENELSPGGLKTTKFHRGFQRRMHDSISNIFSDKEKEYAVVREAKTSSLLKARAARIYMEDRSHGYDIVSGNPYGNVDIVLERPRKIALGNGLTDASVRCGEISLRESSSRYFASPADEAIRKRREELLIREGLMKEKKTGSLAGKADLPSFGVHDQFGKSLYQAKKNAV